MKRDQVEREPQFNRGPVQIEAQFTERLLLKRDQDERETLFTLGLRFQRAELKERLGAPRPKGPLRAPGRLQESPKKPGIKLELELNWKWN